MWSVSTCRWSIQASPPRTCLSCWATGAMDIAEGGAKGGHWGRMDTALQSPSWPAASPCSVFARLQSQLSLIKCDSNFRIKTPVTTEESCLDLRQTDRWPAPVASTFQINRGTIGEAPYLCGTWNQSFQEVYWDFNLEPELRIQRKMLNCKAN